LTLTPITARGGWVHKINHAIDLMKSLHEDTVGIIKDELQHEAIPMRIGNDHWDILKWKRVPGPHPELGVLAGDIVHNVHSALDQLIYVLANERGHDPEADSHYPMHQDVATWTRDVFPDRSTACECCGAGYRHSPLVGLNDAQIAFISERQPYRLPQKKRPGHPLAHLSRLSRIDKHRTLHLCGIRTKTPKVFYLPSGIYGIAKLKLVEGSPIAQKDAEFARIKRRVIRTPQPDVKVEVKVETVAELALVGPNDTVASTLADLDLAIAFARDIVLALGPDSPNREIDPD
jgi:hypothetical protein